MLTCSYYTIKFTIIEQVYKIKFYTLLVDVTDGTEFTQVVFKVVVQTRRCRLSRNGTSTVVRSGYESLLLTVVYIVSAILVSM